MLLRCASSPLEVMPRMKSRRALASFSIEASQNGSEVVLATDAASSKSSSVSLGESVPSPGVPIEVTTPATDGRFAPTMLRVLFSSAVTFSSSAFVAMSASCERVVTSPLKIEYGRTRASCTRWLIISDTWNIVFLSFECPTTPGNPTMYMLEVYFHCFSSLSFLSLSAAIVSHVRIR
ncbi:hypothetical protein M441DRAFT_266931 [Trichoderma asperellum CBS 433.97]|uniref:Uncharacterized protein n=1 Tax=Trichoderma asperellum (strain ATCC 204424 / CBS 433.97 / NBRC 101777) TaxID=1042311 RepID=A0A2T3YY23_TRIA4|nr:hypothetical protein M441DRAFT_266931 [Trichoderma asperellum CBS 433.97]PTB37452.1 hypothetical protein M441DRAFT_266931 [Trichoderma asperellum CBS 433.97]